MFNITNLIDEKKCFEEVRSLRWKGEILCPFCCSLHVIKKGHHETSEYRQRYKCNSCKRRFDDLTDTIFQNSNIALKVWILCSYFMGLNLSNSQISEELGIGKDIAHKMCSKLREGIVKKKEVSQLDEEVEFDEAYVVAGHKGKPEKVKEKKRKPRRRRLKGKRGRGTLADEKVPILGMIKRGGEVVLKMLPNVKTATIEPIIKNVVKIGTLIFTDEYSIYNKLIDWRYKHKTVNHSAGQYAVDEDGD